MDLIDREQLMNYIRSRKINIGKLAHDIIMKQKSVNAVSEEVYTREYNLRKDAEMKAYKLEKALDQKPRWIPVSERLPTGQTEVIASMHDDSGDTPFDYTASGWVTNNGEYWIVDGEINYYVKAWMPLPQPYKKESEES